MKTILIHPTAIVDAGTEIGEGTCIWHFSHIMPNSKIGDSCIIGQNVFIGAGVTIGNGVKIQNNVSVFTGVVCEDDVFIGPSVVFTNVINPRSFIDRKEEFKNTLVKKGATIGANSTIICGNLIGKYSMIGAGSVITKPVLNYALVYGNPARQHGWVSKAGKKLSFSNRHAVCDKSGEKYLLKGKEVCAADEA